MAEEAERHAAALMKEANEQAKKTAEAQQHAKMFTSKRLTAERLAEEARLDAATDETLGRAAAGGAARESAMRKLSARLRSAAKMHVPDMVSETASALAPEDAAWLRALADEVLRG